MSILLTHILFLAGLLVPPTEGIPSLAGKCTNTPGYGATGDLRI